MSSKLQTIKNIELTQKLIQYLVEGKDVPQLPEDVSFVPFSNSDLKLNEANEKLLENLSIEENPIAIAQEPKSSKEQWKIIPVNF